MVCFPPLISLSFAAESDFPLPSAAASSSRPFSSPFPPSLVPGAPPSPDWGAPLYTLVGLAAAAAAGALLGALRNKRPHVVSKGLAIAAFLLPVAAAFLFVLSAPAPRGALPPLPSEGPLEEGAPEEGGHHLSAFVGGAARDWRRWLSLAAASLLLLLAGQGLALLGAPSFEEGPPSSPHTPLSITAAAAAAAAPQEGASLLLSHLGVEALARWGGPQGSRVWGLSILLQMCLLVLLPWLSVALWLLRPSHAAAAVWLSGPSLPSAAAAAAAAAAEAAVTGGSLLQQLLRQAAPAAAVAKALNPSVLLCQALLLALPLRLLPSFAAAASKLKLCCCCGLVLRLLSLSSSSSSSKAAPYGVADVLLLLLLAAEALGLFERLLRPADQQQQQEQQQQRQQEHRFKAFDWQQDSEGNPAGKKKARTQNWVLLKDAAVVAEVPKGEVQGTAAPLFRDKDGDEAYEFFRVDSCGRPMKVPSSLLQRVGRRPAPKLL
ncbi:hypothetical protein Efla_000970 [Eimeria flavescens]